MAKLRTTMSVLLLMMLLIYNIQSSKGLRILGIHALQMRSHRIMFEELLLSLAAKGHQVDVYGHFPLKNPVPNYTDFSLKGLIPPISNNMSFEDVFEPDPVETIKSWLPGMQDSICNMLGQPIFQKLIHDPPNDPPYDLIITELSGVYCYLPFGRHLNLPIIGMISLSLQEWHYEPLGNPINLAMEPTVASSYAAPMKFLERLRNFIIYHRMIRTFSQVTKTQERQVEKYFGPGFPDGFELHKDVSLVLVNPDIALAGMRPFAPKVIPVGGLHVVDRNEMLPEVIREWLDDSKHGCVYFSFGSFTRIETFPRHILQAFYESFENIAPVRLLLKISYPEELPPGLPSNVLTQIWFNQIPVLKHKNTKAFITHGGLMGGQEAIYFGVPMIAIPLFGDQRFNVENYIKRNVAVKITLPEITGLKLTSAINEVLNKPMYCESMKKFSKQFKDHPLTPMETAIYWTEYIHRHGKDALKSPSEDLLWWEKSLWDIYVFLGVVVLISLLVITKVITLFIRFIILLRSSVKQKKC